MKVLLYCQQSYSFAILGPLGEEAILRGHEVIWYCPQRLNGKLPSGVRVVNTHADAHRYAPDVIFVPGNDVPFYFRGIKVQVFHGFAGEKKGHFRIRGYFDLYLTQGPYFTRKFIELKDRFRNFEVVETGWPKLDPYFRDKRKERKPSHKPTLLYAPTFSPRLTSASILLPHILQVARKFSVVIKFHPLMDSEVINAYLLGCAGVDSIQFADSDDLCSLILDSDVLLSDTSSAVYEALVLGRAVVTFNTKAVHPDWENVTSAVSLDDALRRAMDGSCGTGIIRDSYHPYEDGKSARRMMEAAEGYAHDRGIPEFRKVSILRKIRYIRDIAMW